MRIAVLGAGAVGGTLAALLHRAGHEVVVTARGEHGEAVAREGLLLTGGWGEHRARLRVVASLAGVPSSVRVLVGETQRELSPEEERAAAFASRVLATTEDVWDTEFPRQLNAEYVPPQLVLFTDVTQSPCGGASGATGPFYCPADSRAYLDLSFFSTLENRLGAGGDFAAAYVIAHEVAHHVQNQMGILGQVDQARRQSSQTQANALTVRLELQADCLSGVWAAHVDGLLEPGDIEEALNAARMIGDDYLQEQAGRVPQPHTFTHGTSDQRERWFARGYEAGDMSVCDTFAARRL